MDFRSEPDEMIGEHGGTSPAFREPSLRKKIALTVSLIGAMAFIIMLWTMTLPGQIAGTTADVVAHTNAWQPVDGGTRPTFEGFAKFGEDIQATFDAAEQRAAAEQTSQAATGGVQTLRVKLEAASLERKIDQSGTK